MLVKLRVLANIKYAQLKIAYIFVITKWSILSTK